MLNILIHFWRKIIKMQIWIRHIYKSPFGWKGEGGGVEGSRVEFVENRLILGQIYSTLLYFTLHPLPFPQSKRTINFFLQTKKSLFILSLIVIFQLSTYKVAYQLSNYKLLLLLRNIVTVGSLPQLIGFIRFGEPVPHGLSARPRVWAGPTKGQTLQL